MFPPPVRPRVRFDATLASSSLKARFRTRLRSTQKPRHGNTSLELRCPSAFANSGALFFTLLAKGVRRALLCIPGRTARRVWLPSRRHTPLNSWKPLSASDALGLHPTELFSSTVVEATFRSILSALALCPETSSALGRRFDGLIPPWKPHPFAQPE